MRGKDIPMMAFWTIYCHYDDLVMSFDFNIAPMIFMDLMNWVFRSYIDSFVIVFIDDILVYSKNESDHMGH